MTRAKVLGVALLFLAAAGLAAGVANRKALGELARGYARAEPAALANLELPEDQAARGAAYFALHDFGGLNTDALRSVAVPWKVSTAALLLADGGGMERERLPALFARYGFLSPERIANWPEGSTPPPFEPPLGLTRGIARRDIPGLEIEVANLGCPACHAAVGYGTDGLPLTNEAWLGSPNTSIDLEAYTQDLYAALRLALRDEDALIAAIRRLHPRATDRELTTLRRFVFPEARKRIRELETARTGPLPFSNGAPGLTNGVAALKLQTGLIDGPEHGFTAVPELADHTFRSSLLYDGAYAPAGQARFRAMAAADVTPAHRDRLADMTTFFTVPSMGVKPEAAREEIPAGRDVMAFLAQHLPQPFPGRVDEALARRGGTLYAARCASCHGTYEETAAGLRLGVLPNWRGDVGTDPTRARAVTPALAKAIDASAYGDIIDAARTGAYAAPPLTGLWASAPYLHNGSVPTLAQLIGLEPRAPAFQVGGHALDFTAVGVAYPAGYQPWSRPAWIDTSKPGLSNRGHEREFAGLTAGERQALLEFLKRL